MFLLKFLSIKISQLKASKIANFSEDMTEKDSFKVVEETVSINIITPIHDKLCLLLNDGRIFVCSYCMEENGSDENYANLNDNLLSDCGIVSDQPDNTEGQNFYAEKQDSKCN